MADRCRVIRLSHVLLLVARRALIPRHTRPAYGPWAAGAWRHAASASAAGHPVVASNAAPLLSTTRDSFALPCVGCWRTVPSVPNSRDPCGQISPYGLSDIA